MHVISINGKEHYEKTNVNRKISLKILKTRKKMKNNKTIRVYCCAIHRLSSKKIMI